MIKNCVVLGGKVINVGDWDAQQPMPTGAVVEQRDFEFSADRGWYEVGTAAAPTPEERVAAVESAIISILGL